MNLPNQITVSRFLLAIVFIVLMAQFDIRDPQPWLMYTSLGLFVVAGATDFLDGYLARRWNQVTPFGRMLDPLVDKVLTCGAFVFFVGPGFVAADGSNITAMAPWMVALIVGRELLVTDLRSLSEASGQAFGADVFGKIKMWIQMITAGYIMLFVAGYSWSVDYPIIVAIRTILVWLTVLSTTFSGANYVYKARRLILDKV